METAALLISGYCDNDLSDEERLQLVTWLQQDSEHVDRFARECRWHSCLYDFLREQALQSNAWSQALDSDPRSPHGPPSSRPGPSLGSTLGRWMMVFASIAASAAIVAVLYFSLAARSVVAQVSSASGDATMSDGKRVLAGAFLPAGETLRVDRGNVIVTFECGAKVLIEGPALFSVEGRTTGILSAGCASARVPTQAVGFTVRTPLIDIVDLGTEFRVQLLDKERIELHVFDGLVEVLLDRRFDHGEAGPLKITEGRSTRFDIAANEIVTLEYNESLRKEF